MKIDRRNFLLLAALVAAANTFAFGQGNARPTVLERNVRAGMQFLAGDALQGRGSGTIFERIAAEYIGSQFMQFGLEPAGETDAAGSRTFVQTVSVPGPRGSHGSAFRRRRAFTIKVRPRHYRILDRLDRSAESL